MRLTPLTQNTQLFVRRVINLGSSQRLLPGQEFDISVLPWRRVNQLYNQRRVISESDPYFEELMRNFGVKNNPEFAKKWLEKKTKQKISLRATLEIVEKGLYDVIVGSEKLNEKPLRKKEANELLDLYNNS
jgi:hypothetical protein